MEKAAVTTPSRYVAGNVFSRKGLRDLTRQQERFCYHISGGQTVAEASKSVGATPTLAKEWLRNPLIKDIIDGFASRSINTLAITRDSLSMMLLESYYKAGNATEEVNALREIGKLNGLYAPEAKALQITVENSHKMKNLDDAELAKLAGLDDPSVIDADFKEL